MANGESRPGIPSLSHASDREIVRELTSRLRLNETHSVPGDGEFSETSECIHMGVLMAPESLLTFTICFDDAGKVVGYRVWE